MDLWNLFFQFAFENPMPFTVIIVFLAAVVALLVALLVFGILIVFSRNLGMINILIGKPSQTIENAKLENHITYTSVLKPTIVVVLIVAIIFAIGFYNHHDDTINLVQSPEPTSSTEVFVNEYVSSATPAPTLTPTPKATESPVLFADSSLETVLRKKLGKTNQEPVYPRELATITTLTAKETQNKGIHRIDDLSYCVNMVELFLDNNSISDLSPLSGLTKISRLWIKDNLLSDLSPLQGLTEMQHLGICHNKNIKDITPLRYMTKMVRLYIEYTGGITDLSPLDNMHNLQRLQWSGSSLTSAERKRFKSIHPNCELVKK